ncbi:MAG: hypothetical protein R3233_01975 [Xanthomonadales bacterium]|nr:hypothetical protein [Xanthomonadales bacterium]
MIYDRQDAQTRFSIAALLLAVGLALPHAGLAQQDADAAEPAPETVTDPLEIIKQPYTPLEPLPPQPETGQEGGDLCDQRWVQPPLQERVQETLRSWSCHTFRWFDGLWGDTHDFDERGVNGLLIFGAEQTQYDGFDPRLRLRVRASLPNLSRRWDLMLGRVDEESYVAGTQGQDPTFYNPGVVDRGQEPDWLLGLGHRGKERKSGWDYDVGVRLRLPPRPYVKAQWYFNHDFSDDSDFRFRQTFFWRQDQGFGTTSRGDMAVSLNPTDVLRWEGIATVHEETEGVQWYAGQTWYHLFGNHAAISLLAFAEGSTDAEVPLREYGFKLVWRKPFTRDWLYLSVGPIVTWPRERLDEERELSLGFGAWVEMEFGNWRW